MCFFNFFGFREKNEFYHLLMEQYKSYFESIKIVVFYFIVFDYNVHAFSWLIKNINCYGYTKEQAR